MRWDAPTPHSINRPLNKVPADLSGRALFIDEAHHASADSGNRRALARARRAVVLLHGHTSTILTVMLLSGFKRRKSKVGADEKTARL
jgi:hypothetical protein